MTPWQIEAYIKLNHLDTDSEAKMQMKIVSFLDRFKVSNKFRYHYNNSNLTTHSKSKAENQRRGAYNKRMGVKKGTLDFDVACPRGINLHWEFKTIGGKLTPEQKDTVKELRIWEHPVLVTYGLRESIEMFVDWFQGIFGS